MTQEEKTKAYDDAIDRTKEWYSDVKIGIEIKGNLGKPSLKLKESEDERIKTAILNHLKKMWGNCQDDVCGVHVEDAIEWFGKQCEQNPCSMKETTWNKEDEENMNNVLYILNQLKDTHYEEDNIAEKTINWFKSLKYRLLSNNEYDKDMLGAIVYCIKNNRQFEKEHIAWLEKQGCNLVKNGYTNNKDFIKYTDNY